MDIAWTLCGLHCKDTTWVPCRHHMDSTWALCGECMNSTWTAHGHYMDPTWTCQCHVDCMNTNGHHVDTTWALHAATFQFEQSCSVRVCGEEQVRAESCATQSPDRTPVKSSASCAVLAVRHVNTGHAGLCSLQLSVICHSPRPLHGLSEKHTGIGPWASCARGPECMSWVGSAHL